MQTPQPNDHPSAPPAHVKPPYWAVVFTSLLKENPAPDYHQVGDRLDALALQQPGCLGFRHWRNADRLGVQISYWRDPAAIQAWRADPEHAAAMARHAEFYEWYTVEVVQVERAYGQPSR